MNDPSIDQPRLEAYRSRVRGCLLGGAIGDARGGPVEFWDTDRILRACGPRGAIAYVPEQVGGATVRGRITDDTQMTLFTVEGLIRASVRAERGTGMTIAVLHNAYDRWLDTQLLPAPAGDRRGWLIAEEWLYSRRAPGMTCLSALQAARAGERRPRLFGEPARNDCKGCGGVMRSAPFGLFPPWSLLGLDWQFRAAMEAAAYTHGHPTGQIAAGALAVMIGAIVRGRNLDEAIDTMRQHVRQHDGHEETTRAIDGALAAAAAPVTLETVESLGGGWVAEEALAIALYAARAHPRPRGDPRRARARGDPAAATATRPGRSAATSSARCTARQPFPPTS